MNVQRWTLRLSAHFVLIFACATVLLPVYWMMVCAVEPNSDILSTTVHWLSAHLQLGNFPRALQAQPFLRFFINSVSMSVMIVACQVITSSLAAYALVFIPMRRQKTWLYLILLAMMVPMQATFVPVKNYLRHSKLATRQIWRRLKSTPWACLRPAESCSISPAS